MCNNITGWIGNKYVEYWLVSGVALAVEAGESVDTLVSALVNLDSSALVHVTMQGLVAVVRAVWHLVAYQPVVDALAVCTRKLSFRARVRLFFCNNKRPVVMFCIKYYQWGSALFSL